MVSEVSVRVVVDDITYTISIDTETYDNISYDIADVIKEVIHLTSANPDIIIEELDQKYGKTNKNGI